MIRDLDAIRARIDEVDERLVRLIDQRAALVREAAALKAARGAPLLDPAREEAILRRAAALAALPEPAVRAAFTGILDACKLAIDPSAPEEPHP